MKTEKDILSIEKRKVNLYKNNKVMGLDIATKRQTNDTKLI